MKKITLLIVSVLLMACSKPTSTPDETTPLELKNNSMLVEDIYEGVLPAADGPGIKTQVSLFPNGTFIWKSEYLGKTDGIFEDKGTYTVENGVATLVIPQQEGYYLRLAPQQATLLDQDKQPITGESAEQYVLNKTN